MSKADGRRALLDGSRQMGLELDSDKLDKLLRYQGLVQHWNRHFNLVSPNDLDHFVVRHLLDSLALNNYMDGNEIADLGSGAGLPGIPLALLNPQRRFTLIDSNGKKTRFLFQAKVALELANVEVENCRVEHYQSPRQLDIVMCRAFSELGKIIDWASPLLTRNTTLLAMKGKYPEEELTHLPNGFLVSAVDALVVPGLRSERHLVRIRREPQVG